MPEESKIMRLFSAKRAIGAAALLAVVAGGAIVVATRSMRTDVDLSLAEIRENHVCPHCGQVFPLSVADAATMRRTRGDIFCPKCGRPGATKNESMSTELVNDFPPPTSDTDGGTDGTDRPPSLPRKPPRASPHVVPIDKSP